MSEKLQAKTATTMLELAFLIIPGLLLTLDQRTAAQTVTEHPYIAPEEIKSETCLGCHPDKREGRFVHSVVTAGCESCHQATSEKEKEKTTVTLMAEGGELCAMCHETEKDVVVHKPYQRGQCIVCHSPHAANFKAELRAETNTVCLSCHGQRQPDVKINMDTHTASMLGGRTVPFDEYRQASKIGLDRSGTRGHPMMNHPISGKNVPGKDGELTCLSCHAHHCSPEAKRLRPVTQTEIGTCGACHE